MKALCWHGKNDIRCDSVPDPQIEDSRDAIIKMTACAICGFGSRVHGRGRRSRERQQEAQSW